MKSMGKEASPAKSGRAQKSVANGKKDSEASMDGKREGQMNSEMELREFFIDELKDIYWAEKHLVKSLPKMVKAATSQELQNAFEEHLSVTEEQVRRLEEVFSHLDKKPIAKKCEAMDGLVQEAADIISDTKTSSMTRDVGLILAAQKVEHYEIATYGSLRTLAQVLGMQEVASLLESTLNEEKNADQSLTKIAESFVNQEASKE